MARLPRTDYEQYFRNDEAAKADEVVHVEEIDYPLCSKDIGDGDLPFIPAEAVRSRDGKKGSKLCVSAVGHFGTATNCDSLRDCDR